TQFPQIGKLPYLLTLGPHSFYWFSVKQSQLKPTDGKPDGKADVKADDKIGRINVHSHWSEVFKRRAKGQLESALVSWLPNHRWFGGKARTIRNVTISDAIPLGNSVAAASERCLVLAHVDYTDGEPEIYSLPLVFVPGEEGERVVVDSPNSVVIRIHLRD